MFTAHDNSGEIVGAVTTLEKKTFVLEFCRLFVAENHRRKGVGRELINAVDAHARNSGYRSISCLVAEANDPARLFYERLGFTPAYHFGDGDIIYTKQVTEVAI